MTREEFEKKKEILKKRAKELYYTDEHIEEILRHAEELFADGEPDDYIDYYLNPDELVEQPPRYPGFKYNR